LDAWIPGANGDGIKVGMLVDFVNYWAIRHPEHGEGSVGAPLVARLIGINAAWNGVEAASRRKR